jgi:hypothetical protein
MREVGKHRGRVMEQEFRHLVFDDVFRSEMGVRVCSGNFHLPTHLRKKKLGNNLSLKILATTYRTVSFTARQ